MTSASTEHADLGVAVVGAGRIGAFHAATLASCESVREIVVVDPDAGLAASVAAACCARTAPTLDAALAGGVDAVVISAPTPYHAPLSTSAIDHGAAVFCEKPLASTIAEARSLAAHVERIGGYMQVGFQRRFDAGYVAARDEVASGRIGRLYVARLATHDADPPPPTYVEGPDGMYTDTHIHDFDIVRFVTGLEVVEVTSDGEEIEMDRDGASIAVAATILRLADGALAVVTGVRHNPRGYDARIELHGSRDSIVACGDAQPALRAVGPHGGDVSYVRHGDFVERFLDAYREEMRTFVERVRAGASSPVTADDGVRAQAIADAAYRSRVERRPVEVAS